MILPPQSVLYSDAICGDVDYDAHVCLLPVVISNSNSVSNGETSCGHGLGLGGSLVACAVVGVLSLLALRSPSQEMSTS
jgi:hypothetical protein